MANPNGNPEMIKTYNLKNRTTEEQLNIATLGGIASGETRRNKKTYTDAVKWLTNANIKIDKGKIKETLESNGISTKGLDTTQLATIGLWLGAVYGNCNNYKTLMEINGEMIEDTPTFNPSVEEVETIVDNSDLEKVLYEADKSE